MEECEKETSDVEDAIEESIRFFTKASDNSKDSDNINEKRFICQECNNSFQGFDKCLEHMTNSHPDPVNRLPCIVCSRSFKRKDHLKRHLEGHIRDDKNPCVWKTRHQFQCRLCQEWKLGFESSIQHMQDRHHEESEQISCILCPTQLQRKNDVENHLWNHVSAKYDKSIIGTSVLKNWAETQFWHCLLCQHSQSDAHFKIMGMTKYIQHMKMSHDSITGWVCPICKKDRFNTKHHFKAHLFTHQNQKFACEFCGKLISDVGKMKRHVKEVHAKLKNHMCKQCGKCFARPEKVRAHEIVHLPKDSRPYLCHECGKAFGRQEHMLRHSKICGRRRALAFDLSTPDSAQKMFLRLGFEIGIDGLVKDPQTNLYSCPECSNQYKDRRYVAEHVARKHRREGFRCDICKLDFKVLKDLERHKVGSKVHKESLKLVVEVNKKSSLKDGQSVTHGKELDAIVQHNEMTLSFDHSWKVSGENGTSNSQFKNAIGRTLQNLKAVSSTSVKTPLQLKSLKIIQLLSNSLSSNECSQTQQHESSSTLITTQDDQSKKCYKDSKNILASNQELKSMFVEASVQIHEKLGREFKPEFQPEREITSPFQDKKEEAFKCMECRKGFKSQRNLIKHVEIQHAKQKNEGMTALRTSGFELKLDLEKNGTSEERLKREKIVFRDGVFLPFKPMGCLDCDLEFKEKSDLFDHFRNEPHSLELMEYPMVCPVQSCNMTFSSEGRLFQHFKVGKHNQPCPSCGKSFQRLDKLETHLRCHSTDKPYICDLCQKGYKDPTSLQIHRKSHFGMRPHNCGECEAGFMKYAHLKRHISATHLKIKTFKCQFCEKVFGDKYKVRIHERSHTGDAPFLCFICGKSFTRKGSFDQHVLIHSDRRKDFKCAMCGLGFKSQRNLKRHIIRHTSKK